MIRRFRKKYVYFSEDEWNTFLKKQEGRLDELFSGTVEEVRQYACEEERVATHRRDFEGVNR